jgi:hypothetical protein
MPLGDHQGKKTLMSRWRVLITLAIGKTPIVVNDSRGFFTS